MKDTFPAVAAAPALLPLLAPVAVPILIGGAIAAGLLWLLSEDEKPAEANAKTGDTPRKKSGWFFDDEPETQPAVLTETERAARIREVQAEIDRNNAEIRQINAREAKIQAELDAERRRTRALNTSTTTPAPAVRTVTHQATTAPAPSHAPRPAPSPVATVAAPRTITVPAPAAPRPATAPVAPARVAPAATPAAVVTVPRPAAPVVPAPSPVVTIATAPAVAVAVPVKPKRDAMKPRKYDRAHLEVILKAGPLPRAAVVKALKAAPFGYGTTLAYSTLQRFADALEQTPQGLLAWKTVKS